MTIRKSIATLIAATAIVAVASAQQKADYMQRLDRESFSMILLGDPQNYVKYDYNQPVLELMTAWIEDNIDSLKTEAVLCTGDLVDQNECIVPPYPRFGNQTSRQQWEFVSHAFARLDNRVPYIISTGNHDYGYTRSESDCTHFPDYFNIERNSCWSSCVVASHLNRQGKATLENAAYRFEEPNWGKMLVVAIEFAPRDEVLEWVNTLVTSEQYRDHRVILMTHSYLTSSGERIAKEGYKITPANSGEQIWQKLVTTTDNIVMVISGHYAVPDEKFENNVGLSLVSNKSGNQVVEMMFNPQAIGGGMSGNGGDGWLRILEFKPDGTTLSVRTYSPLFGYSPTTVKLAWNNEKCNRFDLKIRKIE